MPAALECRQLCNAPAPPCTPAAAAAAAGCCSCCCLSSAAGASAAAAAGGGATALALSPSLNLFSRCSVSFSRLPPSRLRCLYSCGTGSVQEGSTGR
jgi:hypothetical protein